MCTHINSGVTREEKRGGQTVSGDTLQGVTPELKNVWANLQRFVDKRGRTGKKMRGDTLQGGDTRVKLIISDEQKRSSVFSGKK